MGAALIAAACVLGSADSAGAGAALAAPMPEPLIYESATDIDGSEAGEFEIDLTTVALGRGAGRSSSWSSVLSLEVKATSRLGVEAELGGTGPLSATTPAWSGRATGSFAVLHDPAHDFHLQLEASASHAFGAEAGTETLGDAALPYAAGARWGWRHRSLTLRGGVDGEVGGRGAARVPLLVDLEPLIAWGRRDTPGFAGVELAADLARPQPFAVVPEIAVPIMLGRVPTRVGVASPIILKANLGPWAAGGLLRLVFEIE